MWSSPVVRLLTRAAPSLDCVFNVEGVTPLVPPPGAAAGVVSGLGKGVTASSIGVLLKASGYRVSCIKIGARAPPSRTWWLQPPLPQPLWAGGVCAAAAATEVPDDSPPARGVGGRQTRTSTWTPAPCRRSSTARCSCWTTGARCVPNAKTPPGGKEGGAASTCSAAAHPRARSPGATPPHDSRMHAALRAGHVGGVACARTRGRAFPPNSGR